MTYICIQYNNLDNLTEMVQHQLDNGYCCQGGLCMTIDRHDTVYYTQAMIKEGSVI